MAHVLLVEDDTDTREAVRDALEGAGLQVATAEHGLAALTALASMEPLPHVILTDLDMPYMSGWALLDALQADPRYSKVPVVIGSARANARVASRVVAVIIKPFDTAKLVATVAALVPERPTNVIASSRSR